MIRRVLSAFFFPKAPPTLASDLAGFAIILGPLIAFVAWVKLFG